MNQVKIGLATALMNSDFVALAIVKDGLVVWANAPMHAIFGYAPEELIGQPMARMFSAQQSWEAFAREVSVAIDQAGIYRGSVQQVRKDGTLGWYQFNVSPLAGEPRQFVAAIIDRTIDHALQEALESSERRYRTVVEDQTEVISRFRPDGTYLFVNEVYCRLFGKTAEELIGHQWQPVAHPDDLPMIEARLAEMSPQNPVIAIENRVYGANGELRWMQFVNRGFFDAGGQLIEFQSVGRDITALKVAESALRASEARYRALVDATSTLTWHCPANGLHVAPQPAWMAFTGQGAEEMLGAGWAKAVHPDDVAQAALRWSTAVARDEPFFNEHRIRRHDGEWRWMRVRAVPVRNEQGQTIEWMGMGHDITDLRQIQLSLEEARRRAEQASQVKTKFLATASHDLRQPLQAIRFFAEALGVSALNDVQRSIVSKISHSVDNLGAMLDQLLDLSKLDSGVVKAEPTAVFAEDMLCLMDQEFAPLAAGKNLRFNLFCHRNCPPLFVDRNLLATLLRNLLGNAVKYTERGGILTAFRLRGDRAVVQVWDTGIGIAAADQGNIFQEYFQINNPERDRNKGMGLGLAIVGRVAALLRTEVRCRSRVGRGSVFEFELPLQRGPARRAAAIRQGSPGMRGVADPARGERKRVVIVEDDKEVAEALRQAFEMRGMQSLVFNSAEEAILCRDTPGADCYVSDYRLPGMDGVAFLETIRDNAGGPINAVLVSGDRTPDRVARAREAGWPLLIKPVSFTELLSALAC